MIATVSMSHFLSSAILLSSCLRWAIIPLPLTAAAFSAMAAHARTV